jgi:hypothetical protein
MQTKYVVSSIKVAIPFLIIHFLVGSLLPIKRTYNIVDNSVVVVSDDGIHTHFYFDYYVNNNVTDIEHVEFNGEYCRSCGNPLIRTSIIDEYHCSSNSYKQLYKDRYDIIKNNKTTFQTSLLGAWFIIMVLHSIIIIFGMVQLMMFLKHYNVKNKLLIFLFYKTDPKLKKKNKQIKNIKINSSDITGEISGCPEPIVRRLLECQIEQCGRCDIHALQMNPFRGLSLSQTSEGYEFWRRVLIYKDFKYFYDYYNLDYNEVKNNNEIDNLMKKIFN